MLVFQRTKESTIINWILFQRILEGAAGFGVPIAICAVLLIQLGFEPLKAAMLCLIANGAAGAFGAIGFTS